MTAVSFGLNLCFTKHPNFLFFWNHSCIIRKKMKCHGASLCCFLVRLSRTAQPSCHPCVSVFLGNFPVAIISVEMIFWVWYRSMASLFSVSQRSDCLYCQWRCEQVLSTLLHHCWNQDSGLWKYCNYRALWLVKLQWKRTQYTQYRYSVCECKI